MERRSQYAPHLGSGEVETPSALEEKLLSDSNDDGGDTVDQFLIEYSTSSTFADGATWNTTMDELSGGAPFYIRRRSRTVAGIRFFVAPKRPPPAVRSPRTHDARNGAR